MFKILKSNKRSLQDQLVLFGAGLPCFFVFPFSIYRYMIGDYAIAAIDLMIGLGLVTIFLQTWYDRKNKYLNTCAVICFMTGVAWVMHLKGLSLVFWAFPTLGFTYFVLKPKAALIANMLFLLGTTYLFFDVLTKQQALSIYPSLLLVGLFGYAFSLCSESQNKKLLKLVSEDTLTEVKNRRSFDNKIDEILEQNKRVSNPVCLLVLDLDFFKNVNDNYGHKKGDKVLFDFAQRVKLMIRNTDYIYRFGGEEFVIIATNLELKRAFKFAESIRETVEHTPSLSKYNVTVSIGVSEINKADDADSWFRRSDLALYQAKSKGRNRVCLAEQNHLGEISYIQSKNDTDVQCPAKTSLIKENEKKASNIGFQHKINKNQNSSNLSHSTIS